MERKLAVVIMAAGKGTRMNNPSMAKVMYTIDGRPMVEHVVDLALNLESSKTVVIVGWQKDAVIDHLRQAGKNAVCVEQNPQLGTGHAVMQAAPVLDGFSGDILVLSGDVPLLSSRTVRELLGCHRGGKGKATATVLTAIPDDPTGYGRIIRDNAGHVTGIVEHRDASEAQRAVREINSGIYVFDKEHLFDGLSHITPHNVQNEYYLTDVFQYFWDRQLPVKALAAPDWVEIQGINTPQQLELARQLFTDRRSSR